MFRGRYFVFRVRPSHPTPFFFQASSRIFFQASSLFVGGKTMVEILLSVSPVDIVMPLVSLFRSWSLRMTSATSSGVMRLRLSEEHRFAANSVISAHMYSRLAARQIPAPTPTRFERPFFLRDFEILETGNNSPAFCARETGFFLLTRVFIISCSLFLHPFKKCNRATS